MPGLAGGKKYYNNNDIQSDYFDVAYYVSISVGKWNKEYEIVEKEDYVMSLNKSQVTKLVVDLCWEYDRMSSSGQETLDKLCKVLNIETDAEFTERLASMTKEEINNEILNRSVMDKVDKIVDVLCDFLAYVDSFYNPKNGIYPIKGLTNDMIFTATLKYVSSQTKDYTWGGGDSLDRERVRGYYPR